MKKTIIATLLSLGFFSDSSYAIDLDNKPIKYRFTTEYHGKVEIKFPFIILKDHSASNRINLFLHQSILNTLPPETYGGQIIDLKSVDFVDLSLSNVKLMRDGRALSIIINTEFCGSYCENSDISYDFDTRNGRLLTVYEIIKEDSLGNVAKIVAKANARKIKNFIVQLKKEQENISKYKKSKIKSGDREPEEIDGQIAMYEQCLARYNDDEFYSYGDKNLGSMNIGANGINFSHGRCSNHAMRALDDLWDIVHTIKNEDLRPYLTEYGKYIVFGDGVGEVPLINPYAQLYRGKINNKIDIVMYLGNMEKKDTDYSNLNDYKYFYTKYRQPIQLDLATEKSENGEFVLAEPISNDDGSTFAKFIFKIKGGKLVGQWISKDKKYPFEAIPY